MENLQYVLVDSIVVLLQERLLVDIMFAAYGLYYVDNKFIIVKCDDILSIVEDYTEYVVIIQHRLQAFSGLDNGTIPL